MKTANLVAALALVTVPVKAGAIEISRTDCDALINLLPHLSALFEAAHDVGIAGSLMNLEAGLEDAEKLNEEFTEKVGVLSLAVHNSTDALAELMPIFTACRQ